MSHAKIQKNSLHNVENASNTPFDEHVSFEVKISSSEVKNRIFKWYLCSECFWRNNSQELED
jgi:hypothetical protein